MLGLKSPPIFPIQVLQATFFIQGGLLVIGKGGANYNHEIVRWGHSAWSSYAPSFFDHSANWDGPIATSLHNYQNVFTLYNFKN